MADDPERRRVARVVVPWHLSERVFATLGVRLLDLSIAGARIEHPDLLSQGTICTLDLPPPLGPLHLSARVVWSMAIGDERPPQGGRRLRYQSGLAFTDVTAEQQAILASLLQQLTQAASGEGR